jgi:hypothetical protein
MNSIVVNSIYNFIKTKHIKLFETYNFKYHTQKYKLKEILEAILFFIKISSSWKNFIYKNINYNTIYKNYIKLNKYKIFELSYLDNLKKYLKKSKKKKLEYVYTDTTTVYNKLNKDKAKRNAYFKNKKIIKISLITESNGITLNCLIESGIYNDSTIYQNQIKSLNEDEKKKFINLIFMADSGYNSSYIYIYELNKVIFKKSIIKPNNRNTKNEMKKRKLNKSEEQLYKKRIKVEHTNQKIKAYRRLNYV